MVMLRAITRRRGRLPGVNTPSCSRFSRIVRDFPSGTTADVLAAYSEAMGGLPARHDPPHVTLRHLARRHLRSMDNELED